MTPAQLRVLRLMHEGQLMEMTQTGLRLDGALMDWDERQAVYALGMQGMVKLPVNRFGYGQGRLQPAIPTRFLPGI